MFKRLFLGTTNIDFQNLGSKFYKVFVIEFILFISIILGSIFGILSLNLSVDFTGWYNVSVINHVYRK
jgi:preprotein translocase subunit SecF